MRHYSTATTRHVSQGPNGTTDRPHMLAIHARALHAAANARQISGFSPIARAYVMWARVFRTRVDGPAFVPRLP